MGNDNESLYARIVRWINGCAQNTEIKNLQDALEKGEKAMLVAEGISSFSNQRPGLQKVLGDARGGLGSIKKTLGKAQKMCLDLSALEQIHSAIRVLNQDGVIERKPDVAARAFGNLFVGFGQLAERLPPPANAYAQILKGCGNFFVNMRRALDPNERYKNREDWKEAMK